jgi:hypothetical protein
MNLTHSSRLPNSRKMERESQRHLLDEPKCIEKVYERMLVRQGFWCQWLSRSPGTPVRVDLWCFGSPLHIHLYFVGGHRRLLGTSGNRRFKTAREQGF